LWAGRKRHVYIKRLMEAVILAGGFGTRLRQVVSDVPKPMASIGGRPFLEILLQNLIDQRFEHVVLSLGFMADKVSAYFGSNFEGLRLDYTVEDAPLGTGGGLRLAFTRCESDHVHVLNGDTFVDLDFLALERRWEEFRALVMVARWVDDTSRFGRLEMQGDRTVRFLEKGVDGPGLINAGCYVVPTDALNSFPIHQRFSLETDFLVPLAARSGIDVFVSSGRFIDIGVPEDYARAQTIFAQVSKT
jgi:D-glycero-alpha-D-manno-heptose 1-phosphate guanylyltransferase